MDVRKIILYIALAVVAMSLWNAWQKDYGSQKMAPVTQRTQKAAPTASASDVPQLPSVKHVAKVPTITARGQLIHVVTDTLDVTIDTRGGNIVQAKLLQYPVKLKSKKVVEILSDSPDKRYIGQSGLLSHKGPDTEQGQALYQADKTNYELQPDKNELAVTLTWNNKSIQANKTFIFKRGKYTIDVQYKLTNKSGQPWSGHLYGQLKQKKILTKRSFFYLHTFTGGAISTTGNAYKKVSYKKMDEQNISANSVGGWLAFQQRYFLSAWVPQQSEMNHFYSKVDNGIYTLGFIGPPLNVAVRSSITTSAKLYVGPEVAEDLKALAPHLNLTVDYGFLWIISVAIFWVMKEIYRFVGNWGWAIVFTTLLIKLIFYKLSEKSYRSMAKMRELGPRLKLLKERFGDDKQKMSQATMELYKKEKINPVSGCLPMLIQIPFFIALYWVLIESVELRQAPFLFWIHDLSAKDPYYVLPILMGLSMFVQQKLNPAPPDPTQARMMMLLPVVFTALFLNFPSGLVLYWLTNNVASGLQQWFIMYRFEKRKKTKKTKKT